MDHHVETALNVADGFAKAGAFKPDLLLLDINLPDASGLASLPDFVTLLKGRPVIIMTGETGNLNVVEAMRAGAYDYLKKPLDLLDVASAIDKIPSRSGKIEIGQNEEHESCREFVGEHPSIINLHKQIGLLARSKVTVLIQGESGTGKELVARILHDNSNSTGPFVAVNCSAVVSTLLESEFFGHEKGAFTGADRTKIGKLEYAANGTVFLDEIGDMPRDLQAKLLRVLQEEEFVRVGGLKHIPLQARVIAATHHDLQDLIGQGLFRQDLYFRLAVSPILLPPLSERPDDVPLLVEHLIRKIRSRHGFDIRSITESAVQCLKNYTWPGNVRELENVLVRAASLAKGTTIDADDFQLSIYSKKGADPTGSDLSLAGAEKKHISRVL